MDVLDGKPAGWGMHGEPWKTEQFKGRELCWVGIQIHLTLIRLWIRAPSEKHKCLIPREWFLVIIIIKRGFEGFLEISFYKILFWEFECKSSRNMSWNSAFYIHSFSKYENTAFIWIKNANSTEKCKIESVSFPSCFSSHPYPMHLLFICVSLCDYNAIFQTYESIVVT